MVVHLKNNWLWEGDRKLTRPESSRIARALGYYLIESLLDFLGNKYPNACFKVDSDYRIIGRIQKGE